MTVRILPAVLGAILLIAAPAFTQTETKAAPSERKPSAANRADRAERDTAAFSQTPRTQAMQEAIAFERHKEQAAARQARIEARHPSVTYNNARGAERSTADRQDEGRPVKDEKATGAKPKK